MRPRRNDDRVGAIRAGTILAGLAILAMVIMTGLYVRSANLVATVANRGSQALLVHGGATEATPLPSRDQIKQALATDPLNASVFNMALMSLGREPGHDLPDRQWFETLRKYGWRSTSSLQNIMYFYAVNDQTGPVLDSADALLRRERILDQVIYLLELVEANPKLQGDIVGRLRQRPPWRHLYLMKGATLTDPAMIEGRYRTLLALRGTGSAPTDEELVAVFPALVRAGRVADAFALWKDRHPAIGRPLTDPDFSQAAANMGQDDTANPFAWRLATGQDFDVTAGHGLEIHWNGQGVPVFAGQQTSGAPGSYLLETRFPEENAAVVGMLSYRLRCPQGAVDFLPLPTRDRTRRLFRTNGVVPCGFAYFEIQGGLDSRHGDATINLTSVALKREGALP